LSGQDKTRQRGDNKCVGGEEGTKIKEKRKKLGEGGPSQQKKLPT